MPFNLTRARLLAGIAVLWLMGALVVFALSTRQETVVVTHWSNGHLIRDGSGLRLLRQMAADFNKARHMTQAGKRIEVQVYYYGSWEQARDLGSRVTRRVPIDGKLPDPTIVTPSAAHWLVTVNHDAGRTVVDIGAAESIARAMIGIVTYREIAECLGWPGKEIGYSDIIALRNNPRGWATYPCAKAEWGQRPLVAYTDPTTSDTGRGVLFSLYALAAGKRPEELTAADVADPRVVTYIKEFQGLVDHYIISTRVLNSKVHQGPRYGQFFLMPEDNLIHLIDGTEQWFDPLTGAKGTAPPITRPMVMIYPKEGSLIRDNCACIVHAPWVADDQAEAAEQWIDYLREDDQQRGFMTAGFRPGTNLPLSDPASKITARNGLDPNRPTVVINPDRINPAAAAAIDQAWVDVKKPGVLTFVVDVSGSMAGDKLQQAKDGLIRSLDSMAQNNQVGLITFSDAILTRVPVAPLAENRYLIADAARAMQARSGTALYDAIKAGIEMTDGAAGDAGAIRGVIVLTDGQANRGQTHLDNLIRMMSRNESAIMRFDGFESHDGLDERFKQVPRRDMIGTGLALQTQHRIQVFFIGIGRDADMDIGRLLAEATGAEFQGATEKDLAGVLEEFGKYF